MGASMNVCRTRQPSAACSTSSTSWAVASIGSRGLTSASIVARRSVSSSSATDRCGTISSKAPPVRSGVGKGSRESSGQVLEGRRRLRSQIEHDPRTAKVGCRRQPERKAREAAENVSDVTRHLIAQQGAVPEGMNERHMSPHAVRGIRCVLPPPGADDRLSFGNGNDERRLDAGDSSGAFRRASLGYASSIQDGLGEEFQEAFGFGVCEECGRQVACGRPGPLVIGFPGQARSGGDWRGQLGGRLVDV
jgi:hypothetical protein